MSFKLVSLPAGDYGACECHGVWRWNSEQGDRVGKRKAFFHKALRRSVGCTTLRLTQGGATPPLYFECPTASNSILAEIIFSCSVLVCPFWLIRPLWDRNISHISHHSTNSECVSFSWEDSPQHLGFGDGDTQENLDYSCYTYGIHSYESKCSLRCGLCSLTFRSALIWLNSPYKIWPNNFCHETLSVLKLLSKPAR